MQKLVRNILFICLLIPLTVFSQTLVVNEFLSDPYHESIDPVSSWDANGDGTGNSGDDEFIELVNNSGGTLDISGYTYEDGYKLRHTFDANTILDAGESIVLFGGGLPSTTIPGQVAVADSGSVSLNNGGDVIVIRDANGVMVDSVNVPADADDQAWARNPDITGDFVAHSSFSLGVYYSPGKENVSGNAFPEDALTAELIINEILADPAEDDAGTSEVEGDANGDGTRSYWEDEFVEIVNNSGSVVDISGYTISDLKDKGRVRHIFPANTTIEDGESIVVFGGGTPTNIPGNALVASEGKLDFDNTGDRVTLKNTSGNEVARYLYSEEEGADDQSIARNPDFTGDFVKHSTITTNAVPFSPGRYNVDGTSFSNEISSAPVLVSPENNTEIPDTTKSVEFVWNSVENAELYTIEASYSESFETLLISDSMLVDTNYTYSDVLTADTLYWRVSARNTISSSDWSEVFTIKIIATTGISDFGDAIPEKYVLHQNYPNPFNPETHIRFDITKAGNVTIKIYNLRGQLVRTLTNAHFNAGHHSVRWDGLNKSGNKAASGIYIYRINAGSFSSVRKMILVK